LYKRYHQLAQDELNRTLTKLPDVSETEKLHLEDLTRRIVNKLLHDPVQALRSADDIHTPASQYVHAMEMLFKLSDGGGNTHTDQDSEKTPFSPA
jgi:glutamyl-tRNA reductase